MDDKRWWDLISVACKPGAGEEAWCEGLHRELCKLPVEGILAFDRWFDDLACKACTRDLFHAYSYVTAFGSTDGFYYFRCWLIAQGRADYLAAVENADAIADLDMSDDPEAEIYAQAQRAWAVVTGKDMDEYPLGLPARHHGTPLIGELWDGNDPVEMRRRLPRLVAKHGEEYD